MSKRLVACLWFCSFAFALIAAPPGLYRGFLLEDMHGQVYAYDWSVPALTGFVPALPCVSGSAVSADSSKLFVSKCADGVAILDTATLTYSPTSLNVGGFAGYLAAGPTGRFLYVSSSYSLVVVDLTGVLPNQNIPLTAPPFRIAVTPDNTHVVVSFRAPLAAVIRIGNPHVLRGYIPLAGDPGDVAVSPDSKRAVLPLHGLNAMATIQLATLARTDWATQGCKPHSAAFSPTGARLYLACASGAANWYQIVHGATGALLAAGTPPGPGFDIPAPRTVSVTPDGRQAWFPQEPLGHIWVLNTATLAVTLLGGAEHSDHKVVFGKPFYEPVDAVSGLVSVMSGREAAPAACAAGQVFRVTAKWRNNSAKAWTGVLGEVLTLTGGHTLIEQLWDLTADGIAAPGEVFTGVFRIRLNGCAPFNFQVTLGATAEPMT